MDKRQSGKTFGNRWMFNLLIKLLQYIDIRVLYHFMTIFIIPPTLLFSPGARFTYHYFHNILGHSILTAINETYRNHIIFGKTVIDKFSMYAGHKFRIRYYGLEEYKKLTSCAEPFIQLSAHIGCSEIIGYSYDNTKPLNVLVFGGEKKAVMSYRHDAFGNKNVKMIPVGTDDSHSDEISVALDNGEIIYAFADRFANKKKFDTSLLWGHRIKLARGPFSLAITRGLNVVMTCAMKEEDGSYTTYLKPLYYDKTLSKREQRQQLANSYVKEIENLLEIYPLQWFNYSNIWID